MPMRTILGTMTIGGQADEAAGAAMLDGFAAAVGPHVEIEVDTARMYQVDPHGTVPSDTNEVSRPDTTA